MTLLFASNESKADLTTWHSDLVFTAAYDEENRLVSISYTDGAGLSHETRYTYRYDSFLVRIQKYENSVLTTDTRIIRNGKLPIQERDASNNVSREYAWGQSLGGGIGGLWRKPGTDPN